MVGDSAATGNPGSDSSMQHIRAITLDLDDTLWPIRPVIERAEERLRAWLGEQYPRVVERFTLEAAQAQRDAVALEFHDRAHDLAFLRRETLRRMGEHAGYHSIDVEAAAAAFDAARNEVDLYPDVMPALIALRRHYRLVAVTNGTACLERIGIHDLFDACINACSAGAPKPARQIFDAAIAAARVGPAEAIHVGDQPHADVAGARAAGLAAAWINREGRQWPGDLALPDTIVRDLHELDAHLAAARA